MRLKTIQIVAALAAAVAFLLAFMAAGVVFVSTLFMAAGLAAVAWLAWSLIRQVGTRGRKPARAGRP
jgi:threonine/homoserine/homoserine lactone efflux protein